jgi:hypothetical protein
MIVEMRSHRKKKYEVPSIWQSSIIRDEDLHTSTWLGMAEYWDLSLHAYCDGT